MPFKVLRAINGISLNGNFYLLDKEGKEMEFESEQEARDFLLRSGVPEQAIDNGDILIEEE